MIRPLSDTVRSCSLGSIAGGSPPCQSRWPAPSALLPRCRQPNTLDRGYIGRLPFPCSFPFGNREAIAAKKKGPPRGTTKPPAEPATSQDEKNNAGAGSASVAEVPPVVAGIAWCLNWYYQHFLRGFCYYLPL